MFTVYRREIADVEPFAFIPVDTEIPIGTACKLTSGKIVKCAATDYPAYITQGPKRSDGTQPCIRVLPTTIFQTTTSGAIAETKVGTSVQLGSDAATVTATATGPFIVTYTENNTTGPVRGYFKEAAAGVGG